MATVSIYLDNRTTKEGYSVKYLVTHNRKQRLFATGKIVTDIEAKFLKQYAGGLKGTVKDEDRRKLWFEVYDKILKKGQEVLKQMGEGFSFDRFRVVLKGGEERDASLPDDAFVWFDAEIEANNKEKRLGNKDAFQAAKQSIARYASNIGYRDTLPFSAIDVRFLKGYEKWMLTSGKLDGKKQGGSPASKTTVGIYLRALRAIYKKQALTDPDEYPFSGKGYTVPKGNKKKKAMDSDVIGKLLSYRPESSYKSDGELSERDKLRLHYRTIAHDLWVFSYLSNGANMADILRIRKSWVNFDEGKIRFIRKKTANTTEGDANEIVIHLLPAAGKILKKWWNSGKGESVWSFLAGVDLDDTEKMEKIVNSYVVRINKHMRRITKELGINVPVRTYEARHSFATTLARSEVPLLFISQALGHKSIATTQIYLGSFEDEAAHRYMGNLMLGVGEEEG